MEQLLTVRTAAMQEAILQRVHEKLLPTRDHISPIESTGKVLIDIKNEVAEDA